MLEIRNINAFYGDSHILHDISLTIEDGARVAILGRNGAGKSTLLKSISNAGPTIRGSISWRGKDLAGMPSHRRAQMGLSFVPEDRRILASLTVFENLRMAYTGTPAERRTATPQEVLEQFPLLVPLRNREGGFLSGGQQQLLAVARAAIANPSLLLLDEPTEGLAPVIVEELARDVIRICDESSATLLLCEQSIWFSRKCTDYVHIIDSGKLVFSGTWRELDEKPSVRNRHLAVA